MWSLIYDRGLYRHLHEGVFLSVDQQELIEEMMKIQEKDFTLAIPPGFNRFDISLIYAFRRFRGKLVIIHTQVHLFPVWEARIKAMDKKCEVHCIYTRGNRLFPNDMRKLDNAENGFILVQSCKLEALCNTLPSLALVICGMHYNLPTTGSSTVNTLILGKTEKPNLEERGKIVEISSEVLTKVPRIIVKSAEDMEWDLFSCLLNHDKIVATWNCGSFSADMLPSYRVFRITKKESALALKSGFILIDVIRSGGYSRLFADVLAIVEQKEFVKMHRMGKEKTLVLNRGDQVMGEKIITISAHIRPLCPKMTMRHCNPAEIEKIITSLAPHHEKIVFTWKIFLTTILSDYHCFTINKKEEAANIIKQFNKWKGKAILTREILFFAESVDASLVILPPFLDRTEGQEGWFLHPTSPYKEVTFLQVRLV